jgi:hypothetical protein
MFVKVAIVERLMITSYVKDESRQAGEASKPDSCCPSSATGSQYSNLNSLFQVLKAITSLRIDDTTVQQHAIDQPLWRRLQRSLKYLNDPFHPMPKIACAFSFSNGKIRRHSQSWH